MYFEDQWTMSVCPSIDTLGTTLYGQDLGYPSWDFVPLSHMEWTYIEAVFTCIIFEKLKNCNFGDFPFAHEKNIAVLFLNYLKNGTLGDFF